jgi:ADP-dependent NAD(P)H-hydrate dehydratase / NAD(P)H-hydrate epimerase
MLKIFSVDQVRRADDYTIQNEPIPSIDLMERAAGRCFAWILPKLAGKKPEFYIFCGPGNNGGDGLAIARMLNRANYGVHVAIPDPGTKFSTDFKINLDRLKDEGTGTISFIEGMHWNPDPDDVIVDALFGSGLSKPVSGHLADVIRNINSQECIVVSIDIPSGLYADKAVSKEDAVVNADYTLSFQFPKLAFFFAENDLHLGEWEILPIGLHQGMIDTEPCHTFFITENGVRQLLKPRRKFSHKGTYGHALLISGSLGKTGASVLASGACLRSGAGLLTTHLPKCGYQVLQASVPETMVSMDSDEEECSRLPDLGPYSAIGAGPGLGTSEKARNVIRLLLQEAKVPLVLDADALNILAEEKTWQAFLPAGSILTPHPREFERLSGKTSNSFEQIESLRSYCIRNKVYVILKGAYTITGTPSGSCFFNSTGNPGMATGGSGDVLTGIITGLLAQHYTALDACLLGVYLHGLAGDLAAEKIGKEALIAGDLVRYLGKAFKKLY